jgi:orotate phosphoribosyltransferase
MPTDIKSAIVKDIHRLVANYLWQINAVRISIEQPFKLTSGNYSPIYLNCRLLISSVAFMNIFTAASKQLLEHHAVQFETIAGGETAGIPFAAFLAYAFNKPMIYVRKAAKEHGLGSRLEGILKPESQVLLVEDLITDAGSKLNFIQGIREGGGEVKDVLVVFDRLQGGKEALRAEGIELHALTDIEVTLSLATEEGLCTNEIIQSVRQYLDSPKDWHKLRGLEYNEQ